jgi:hypothetical protein
MFLCKLRAGARKTIIAHGHAPLGISFVPWLLGDYNSAQATQEVTVKFEAAGRAMDREVEKLVNYVEQKLRPATRKETAKLLRKAARRLAKLALSLEKREQ